MKTTEHERYEVLSALQRLGFDYTTAQQLRRISMTLRNWFELECGSGTERVSVSIERNEDGSGKPFRRVQYQGPRGWVDQRFPIPDKESGARNRLAKIMAPFKRKLVAYVQGDPRGCALYIVRKKDIPKGCTLDSVYTRGVAVY